VRGINSQAGWDDIRLRTEESNCGIICFQETKKESFDLACIKKFCHRRFNNYVYTPSIGNFGGLITIWNGSLFSRTVISQSRFQITVEFLCNVSSTRWTLTNVYGLAHNDHRNEFIDWLVNVDITQMKYRIMAAEFNFIRDPQDRNKPSGDINNIMLFSSAIQALDLEEIPLKGRSYTWSNM
jgi:hypothetical protein